MSGADGRPATLGDINNLYGQIDKRHEKSEERFEKAIEDKIKFHSADCPALDYYKVQKEVRKGTLPSILSKHPIAVIGGGGTGLGTLVFYLLNSLIGG